MADNRPQQPFTPNPMGQNNQPPLTDEKFTPVQDGMIPQDAKGITKGQYDALDPTGNVNIKFESGNYHTIMGLPQLVGDKVASLAQTLVPLIEVSLIELLGDNSMYKRALGQCQPAFDNNGKISIEFTFQYLVGSWITTDINLEALQHDSNFVLDRIKPAGSQISKCEVDCKSGTLTICGVI